MECSYVTIASALLENYGTFRSFSSLGRQVFPYSVSPDFVSVQYTLYR
jgi:hypothetical protein